MNLLEKMKLIAEGNKMALEDSPDICRAVLAAMDEIKKQSEKFYPPRCESEFYYSNGVDATLSILRKHLEGEKETNHDQ